MQSVIVVNDPLLISVSSLFSCVGRYQNFSLLALWGNKEASSWKTYHHPIKNTMTNIVKYYCGLSVTKCQGRQI